MKKLLILLLCLSLTIACFIGCSSEDKNLDDEEFSSFESTSVTSSETSSETTSEETTAEILETESETSESVKLNTTETETTENEKIDYTLHKVGDQWYLKFDYNTNEGMAPVEYRFPIVVDSIEELKYTIENFDVEEYRYLVIGSFRRDENGFKILDPNNIYYPYYLDKSCSIYTEYYSIPHDTHTTQYFPVSWFGDKYVLNFSHNETVIGGQVTVFTKDAYENQRDEFPIKETDSSYVITRGNKKATVIYNLKNGVYSDIRFYLEEGDMYSLWSFFELSELPSEDFVFSFGLDKYVAPAN